MLRLLMYAHNFMYIFIIQIPGKDVCPNGNHPIFFILLLYPLKGAELIVEPWAEFSKYNRTEYEVFDIYMTYNVDNIVSKNLA